MEGNYLYVNLIVKKYNMLQCNKIILNLMLLKSPIKINSTGEKCLKYHSLESGISRTQFKVGFLGYIEYMMHLFWLCPHVCKIRYELHTVYTQ